MKNKHLQGFWMSEAELLASHTSIGELVEFSANACLHTGWAPA